MPSISCRNLGSDCDWFVNDPDEAGMLVALFAHNLRTHKKVWALRQKAFNEGELKLSELIGPLPTVMKIEPSDDAIERKIACREFGPKDCEVVVSQPGAAALLTALFAHMEKNHPDFIKDAVPKIGFLKFLESACIRVADLGQEARS
jgi:predicted small metal-binding protein